VALQALNASRVALLAAPPPAYRGGVRSWSIDTYLDHLAARHPTPAGAAVAALSLAQGAALLAMVARLRLDPEAAQAVIARAEEVREAALRLAETDAAAVDAVAAAYALPRSTDAQRTQRTAAIADSLLAAAGPPAELVAVGAELVELCERATAFGSGALLGDVAAAADAAGAALSISRTNVEADIGARRDTPEAGRLVAAVASVDDLLRRAAQVREGIRRTLSGR
jgi:formiminotetrahydrofolate cyclodeaminase